MYRLIFAVILVIFLAACEGIMPAVNDPGAAYEQQLRKLVGTDQAFSYDCETKGYKTAFLQYADAAAVLLRPGMLPLEDDAVVRFITSQEDTSFTMSWKVKGADLSRSGDLGYTYGVYTVKAGRQTLEGTYVSIWKKQADGTWKFVLDSGNDGIGTPTTNNNP